LQQEPKEETVGSPFAIYVRVSEVGGRKGESFGSPEEQEAAARSWADRAGEETYFDEEECVDLDVSGELAAEDRKLGGLIARCESGEFAGVVVRYEDRFARDVTAGSVALARLVDCGARLVATASGFDSAHLTPDKQMVFSIMMAVGQAQRERNRDARMSAKERAAARGVYCAPAPFGYEKDEAGRLVANEDADIVRDIFKRRAAGAGFSEIARDLPMTRSGVRRVVMNRAYLGEQSIPDRKRKGEPKLAADYPGHPPLVTSAQWEAANAVQGLAPRHTGLGERTKLKGVVRCGVCGGIMHVLAYGKAKDKRTFACARGHGSMAVSKIEPAVLYQLDLAVSNREPHIAAVIEGDTRYTDALIAVEDAQRTLAEYRDSLELQRELGVADFAAGLRARKEAVELARKELRGMPKPEPSSTTEMTLEEFDLADSRRFYARAIAEVLVFPKTAEHRLTMRWQGSEEAFPVPPVEDFDLIAATGGVGTFLPRLQSDQTAT
jgi:DNA invertase Pin-like site-specific DNA recombinase